MGTDVKILFDNVYKHFVKSPNCITIFADFCFCCYFCSKKILLTLNHQKQWADMFIPCMITTR